jgi:hypothetical protein
MACPLVIASFDEPPAATWPITLKLIKFSPLAPLRLLDTTAYPSFKELSTEGQSTLEITSSDEIFLVKRSRGKASVPALGTDETVSSSASVKPIKFFMTAEKPHLLDMA